jgi:hypothetical protein
VPKTLLKRYLLAVVQALSSLLLAEVAQLAKVLLALAQVLLADSLALESAPESVP